MSALRMNAFVETMKRRAETLHGLQRIRAGLCKPAMVN